MSTVSLNISDYVDKYKKFASFTKNYDSFLRNFLVREGNIVLANTKRLTPVRTGDLRNRWEITNVTKTVQGYQIQIFNTLYYASYIEEGHRQRVGRFVPGVIVNGQFQFKKGATSGIVLKRPFINGFHMCQISLEQLDANMRRDFEQALKAYLLRCNI